MTFHTEVFDGQLDEIPIYQRYPALKPFVGTDYGVGRPKILLIGESHYLPEGSVVHLDPERWYEGSESALKEKEADWIRTRTILDKDRGDWRPRGHTIYRRLEEAMVDAGIPASDSVFKHVAFMNAFQRPAENTGDSIKTREIDCLTAVQTIDQVVRTIRPDHVVFVSKKAYLKLKDRIGCVADGVKHPASAWWFRKHRNESAKEKFTRLIAEYLKTKD